MAGISTMYKNERRKPFITVSDVDTKFVMMNRLDEAKNHTNKKKV